MRQRHSYQRENSTLIDHLHKVHTAQVQWQWKL